MTDAAAAVPSARSTRGQTQTEQALVHALVFFRVAGLLQISIAGYVDLDRYRSIPLVVALITAVAAQGALLCAYSLRRGHTSPSWITADVVFCAVCLTIDAGLTTGPYGRSWVDFMYPFSVITSYGVGIAYRRWTTVVAVTTILAAAYLTSATAIHHDLIWNDIPDALTYYPNTLVAWAVARQLRHTSRNLDQHLDVAVTAAADLARERERLRHARILHDRVLQTMEALAQGQWITDADLRAHIAEEAAWLRGLVQGASRGDDGDLLANMQVLVQRASHHGLRVRLNDSGYQVADVSSRQIPAESIAAVIDATREALFNVTKHAGVDTATLRLTVVDHTLVVSLLDHGRGFDPQLRRHGLGLDQSIHARVAEAGGTVEINSAPGAGTHMEIRMPLPEKISPHG